MPSREVHARLNCFGRLCATLDSEGEREREKQREECCLWEEKEVGVNMRKEKLSQFL